MRLLHISDLHLGKRLNEFSLYEDQLYILDQIMDKILINKIDTVLISGDIYDKSQPSEDAYNLFDDFLSKLNKNKIKTMIIAGNHDSATRLSFASSILKENNIYISPKYDGVVSKIILNDEYGNINFYLLPFVKPVDVRKYFPDSEINDYNDAIKVVIDDLKINKDERNILLSHQFVTGAKQSESEISVGGSENVSVDVYKDFDYVALGHLHIPQKMTYEYIRYSGSPLKYSFSEIKQDKNLVIIDIKEKNNLSISFDKLIPLHDLKELKGFYNELMDKSFYEGKDFKNDYLRIILDDEEDIIDALIKMRNVYPNIMRIEYKKFEKIYENINDIMIEDIKKTPYELLEEFYQKQNDKPINSEQQKYIKKIIEEVFLK